VNGSALVAPRWIVSRRFDLLTFFGGAGLSVLFLALYFVVGAPIVALWWVWLLVFDGPHIGAAFTRTYLDRREWKTRPGLLLGSLLTFTIGPLFLAVGIATRSDAPFLLFLGIATSRCKGMQASRLQSGRRARCPSPLFLYSLSG
jgi:hypothetical protein